MPRFGIKSLLVGFLLISLWLSTLSGYQAAADVHQSILLIVSISAGIAAIYGRERVQAFAIAFLAMMFFASDFFTSYRLRFDYLSVLSNRWADAMSSDQDRRHYLNLAFLWALISLWTLVVAALAGAAGALTYDRCRGSKKSNQQASRGAD